MSYITQMTSLGVIAPGKTQERYGVSEESFNEIQAKAGRTTQQIAQPLANEQLTLNESQIVSKFKEALEYQHSQFTRYRDLAEQKFTTMSKQMLDLQMQLKASQEVLQKLQDKADLVSSRQALHAYQKGESRAPIDVPIDRNGVAPKDVRIGDIFNCSGKRF